MERPKLEPNNKTIPQPSPQPIIQQCITDLAYDKIDNEKEGTLLATACVKISNDCNIFIETNILCDTGSQLNFITENLVNRLKLKRKNSANVIFGIGNEQVQSKGFVRIKLHSSYIKYCIEIDAIILPNITASLPNKWFKNQYGHLKNLQLADNAFNRPKRIDVLVGAHVWARIIEDKIKKGLSNEPIAQLTKLGWVIYGPVPNLQQNVTKRVFTLKSTENIKMDLEKCISKLWELEEFPKRKFLTKNEIFCENSFKNSVTRLLNGRYIVDMPIKTDAPPLGESRSIAIKKLNQLEYRFRKSPWLKVKYVQFMDEYEDLGHMREVTALCSNEIGYYIPHHAVAIEKEHKFRVVFNASSKTLSGISLNDIQVTGERLQDDLTDLLMRFRKHKNTLTADIRKMFRQILISEHQLNYQRIVWRRNSNEPIKDYQLLTVTYGEKASPHLAVRTLQQCAHDYKNKYPKAAEVLLTDFYVDDLLSGTEHEDEAMEIYDQLTKLLLEGNFELAKWKSNSSTIMQRIGVEDHSDKLLKFQEDEYTSILGMKWCPKSDVFTFAVESTELSDRNVTKRLIAQQNAKLYDPSGLLSPVVIISKITIQKLWKLKIGWDELVPNELKVEWQQYQADLTELSDIQIPRWFQYTSASQIELHGFCDASIKAYGAVVYIRVHRPNGKMFVSLIASKSRVAPIKLITIPRLELLSAKLLSDLMEAVKNAMQFPQISCYYWCDSQIVLRWLKKPLANLQCFVANRIAHITELTDVDNWCHVSTTENPADFITRGLTVSQLKNAKMWWHGPKWLVEQKENWPKLSNSLSSTEIIQAKTEEKENVVLAAINRSPGICNNNGELIELFSNLDKILRIVSYVHRFINIKLRNQPQWNNITLVEKEMALMSLIRIEQSYFFYKEIASIKNSIFEMPKSSSLYGLKLIIDSEGTLRAIGRINKSQLPHDTKTPILLPSTGTLVNRIITEAHIKTGHGGCELMLFYLRQKFYIINMRKLVKKYIRNCVRCIRAHPRTTEQLMGELPEVRVTPGKCFSHVGVDYFGPFLLKARGGRGKQIIYKGYGAVFVCMKTKAVHIELVEDMTTVAFLAALSRLYYLRGKVEHIYSDNGLNFVGAQKELDDIRLIWEQIADTDEWKARGINWSFNTPLSPHQGGIWESCVKCIKRNMYKLVGNQILTFQEMRTLLAEISGFMNSRPLIPITDGIDGVTILTPAHFLSGEPIVAPIFSDATVGPRSLSQRWAMVQEFSQQLWEIWEKQYVLQLFKRQKWKKLNVNVKVGDIVLVKHENMVKTKWPLGIVVEVYPDSNGVVRNVLIGMKLDERSKLQLHEHTSLKCYNRSIQNICILQRNQELDQ